MWKIGWGLSNLCNMRCKFCYSKKFRKDFSADTVANVMGFLAKNAFEIDSINFGTGEPTIVPAFFEICKKIKSYNQDIKIGVTTNGSLCERLSTDDNLSIFQKYIDDVDVSLDNYIPQKHDASRGFKGAFNNAIKTLEFCKKYQKNTSIVCALQQQNCSIENIDGLMRLARIFDATFRINIYRPTATFDFVIGYEDLKRAIMHIVDTYSVISISDPLFAWLLQMDEPCSDPTGKSSFRILPNGKVSPSTYLLDSEWVGISLSDNCSMQELKASNSFTKIDNFQVPLECLDCVGVNQCKGGAIDRRWLWYKDYDKQDPYCPKRFDDEVWRTKDDPVNIVSVEKGFVHDGYLPTLFFSPVVRATTSPWEKIYQENVSYLGSDLVDDFIIGACAGISKFNSLSVLDAGSGLGRNGRWFLERGAHVTFCDLSFTANDLLQKKLLQNVRNSDYRIIQKDYLDFLQAENQQWDIILMLHILSHGTIDDIYSAILLAIDRLKNNGFLFCTLPSIRDYRFLQNKEGLKSFELKDGPECGIMHSFFDLDDVYATFERQGEIIAINESKKGSHAHWEIVFKKEQ